MNNNEIEIEAEPAVETEIDRVELCAKLLQYHPNDSSLLRTALTHRSYSSENEGVENNERLEFLGDAVLDLVLSDILFRENSQMPEGEMAKARSAVVNEDTLANIATDLELGNYMFFGVGEARSGGAKKRSILADALEAIIAAMYLDKGYEEAKSFVSAHWLDRAKLSATDPGSEDYKTRFQEELVKYNNMKPKYVTEAQGPEHDRIFNATVYSGDTRMGTGSGRSKKMAEQVAAKNALKFIDKDSKS